MKYFVIALLVMCLAQTSLAVEKYTYFSSKPDNNSAVKNAPEYRYGWTTIHYPNNKYGTAKLLSVKGPGVVALAPSFGTVFQVKLQKTAYRNLYCFKPPCYVGTGMTLTIDFKANQQYKSAMRYYPRNQPITLMCQATQGIGTLKAPFVHTVDVYDIQRRMIFSCR